MKAVRALALSICVTVSPFVQGSPPNPAITPPASGFSIQGGNYNLGVVFTANNDLTVDGLGFFYTVGYTTQNQWVGLYDSGQNLIASALVLPTGSTTSGYFWQNITPVALISGQTYTVDTAYGGTNLNSYIYSTVNVPSFYSQVTFVRTTYAGSGPSLVFPSSVDGGAPFYYGPNFSIATSVPEPSAYATLVGLAALGVAAYRRRRERVRWRTRTSAYARGATCLQLVLGFVLLADMPARLAGQTVFNPATDFSVNANPGPGGVWSYGYAGTPGQFALFPLAVASFGVLPAWRNTDVWPTDYPTVFYNDTNAPYVYPGGTMTIPTSQFGLAPGDSSLAQDYAVARLTLPIGGTFLLNAAFVGLESSSGGTTTDVHVFINGASVFDGTVWGFNQTATLIDYTFGASAGSTVDFLVGNGGNGFIADTTGLTASVVAVPEPSTYAALVGLGVLWFAAYRRRCRRAG